MSTYSFVRTYILFIGLSVMVLNILFIDLFGHEKKKHFWLQKGQTMIYWKSQDPDFAQFFDLYQSTKKQIFLYKYNRLFFILYKIQASMEVSELF